jgi:hypothetical protein
MLSVSDHEKYAYLVETNNGGGSVSQRTLRLSTFSTSDLLHFSMMHPSKYERGVDCRLSNRLIKISLSIAGLEATIVRPRGIHQLQVVSPSGRYFAKNRFFHSLSISLFRHNGYVAILLLSSS